MNPPETKPKKITVNDVIKMIPKRADWFISDDGDDIRTKGNEACPISSIKDENVYHYEHVARELGIPYQVKDEIVRAADHSLAYLGARKMMIRYKKAYWARKKLLKWLGLKDDSEKKAVTK